MRRTVFICSLVFICLASGGAAYGQTKESKPCPFNIVGTWKSESGNPIYFSFGADGSVTLLTPSTSIPNENFEVMAAVKYKLDKPAAPTSLDIIAERGNEVFGRGTTTLAVTEFSDDSFTTANPNTHANQTRWVRAKAYRYFLTFAARSAPLNGHSDGSSVNIPPKNWEPPKPSMGGPAFAMWTKFNGRKTEVETLGLHHVTDSAGRMTPVVGAIPAELHKQFLNDSRNDSDVMIRLELTEAEYVRTHKVFKTWDRRVREKTLLYDDPYLNAMEFLRRTAESLNQCGQKVTLHTLNWSQWDEVVTKHHLPLHPLEYIRIMRRSNDGLHVTDGKFPADWRPTQ